VALIDALGHGDEAHAEALQAEAYLADRWEQDFAAMFQGLNRALGRQRGIALVVAEVDAGTREVRAAGVGNVSLRILSNTSSVPLTTIDGIVGQRPRTPSVATLAFPRDSVLLLCTDGIESNIAFEDYPQMGYQSPRTVARNIVRRHGKVFDDATCVVVRWAS
jgi:serine/threonine protein phosphatase PrpC